MSFSGIFQAIPISRPVQLGRRNCSQFEDSNWQKLLAENFLEVVGQPKVFFFETVLEDFWFSLPSCYGSCWHFLKFPPLNSRLDHQNGAFRASFWLVNDHGFTSRWHEMNKMNISCLPLRKFKIDVKRMQFFQGNIHFSIQHLWYLSYISGLYGLW